MEKIIELRQKISDMEKLEEENTCMAENLRKLEQEKTAILDSMFEYIVLLNRNLEIIWTNKAVNRHVKLTPDQLRGMHCYEIVNRHNKPCKNCAALIAMSTGNVITKEGQASLGRIWATRYYPMDEEKLLLVFTDITEKKKLEKEILEISERERREIGQELHDGLGQLLTGIALKSKSLSQNLARESLSEANDAHRITELANEAINQTRQLIKGLVPTSLEWGGLPVSLNELAESISSSYGIPCMYNSELTTVDLDIVVANQLYRIAQEATINAAKHSRASLITISLEKFDGYTVLSVKDDGIGFPSDKILSGGRGIAIMKHRASMIDAILDIRKNVEGGITARCEISDKRMRI
jgi:nitrate/nitrite-specific signal transduction histidine kinase